LSKGAAVPSDNAARICVPVPATAAPDETRPNYLHHEEVRATPDNQRPWQRIWDETAPQARRRDFEQLVKAVGPLPMTALATSTTKPNGAHR